MARQTKAFWVGAFVISGLAIGLAALVWLGIQDWFAEKRTYVTYFDVSVQGLNVDSSVKFRGVDVGKVRGVKVAPDGILIEVLLELQPEFEVTDSLRCQLGMTGITGLKYIEMDFAGLEKRRLHPELKFEPPFQVIPSVPGGFEEIEQAIRETFDRINSIDAEGISWRIKNFLDKSTVLVTGADSAVKATRTDIVLAKLNTTLDHTDSLIEVMVATVQALDTQRMNTQIDSTLAQLRTGSRSFRQTMSNLDEESARLNVSERIDSLLTDVNSLVRTSNQVVVRTQFSTLQLMNNMNQTMQELNQTIDQLQTLLVNLENYPSSFLFQEPPEKEK